MVEIEVGFVFSVDMELQYDERKAVATAGNRLAKLIKRRIRSGLDGDRSALPAGITLRRTEVLVDSIQFHRKLQAVAPNFRSRQDVSPRARNNYGLMAILVSRKDKNRRRHDPAINPMGAGDPLQQAQLADFVQDALNYQLEKRLMSIVSDRMEAA